MAKSVRNNKHRHMKTKSNQSSIISDSRESEHVPNEPSVMERTKEALENIGTQINSI
ncbi:hypothetical protein ABDI30_23640 [Paenibacillus cisolokensis]|uniref:hypothetical protein n=1 Tax=Paenibacillus cisolokensis TaxID=1658519 RepID=UPI003D2BB41A